MSGTSKRPRGSLLGVALFVGIGLAVTVALLGRSPQVTAGRPIGVAGLDAGPPVAGGVQESLSNARSNSPVPIYLPETKLASDDSITGVWVSSSMTELWVEYSSGVAMRLHPVVFSSGSAASFYEQQIKDGTPGTIEKINGIDSFVVPPDSQGDTGSVEMDLSGTDVVVLGNGTQSADQLVEIAGSIPLEPQSADSPTPTASSAT